jgi:hypothetical protein
LGGSLLLTSHYVNERSTYHSAFNAEQVEELSVVDDNELVVDELPDVVEDEEVARLLGGQTDAELEARLAIRQKLPLLPAATGASASRLTDMAHVIPEDQEREQDEQDGWGPPPVTASRTLPTDSQLIEENGHVSMSELQETSESGGQGLSARSDPELSVSFPFEPASPNVDGVATQQQQSSATRVERTIGSETGNESDTRFSPDRDDGDVHQNPGSIDVPIDLTGDEDQDEDMDSPGSESQTLSRADNIYDDAELYTQPPDGSTQEKSWHLSLDEDEASQDGRRQPQVVDNPQLSTQLPDTPGDLQSTQASGPHINDDAQGIGSAHQAAEAQAVDATSMQSSEVHELHEESDAGGALASADVATRDNVSDHVSDHPRQDREVQEHQTDGDSQRPGKQKDGHKTAEDTDADQPRGLGDFFRRLASNLGMVPTRTGSSDHRHNISSTVKKTSDEAIRGNVPEETVTQTTHEREPMATSTRDSSTNAGDAGNSQLADGDGNEEEGEQSQNPVALVDDEMWHTQAPDGEEASDNEHSPSSPVSSIAPDYGYEQEDMDDGDVEMVTDSSVVAATSLPQPIAAPVSVEGTDASEDEDHADLSAGASASSPPVAVPHYTTATVGKKRAERDQRHDSPASRTDRHDQLAHTDDGDIEEAKEEGVFPASKRRRLERMPELLQRLSTRMQTPDSSRSSNHDHPMLARLRNAEPPSSTVAAHVSTSVRPSKRFEALFPPLRMGRILQLIAEKKD